MATGGVVAVGDSGAGGEKSVLPAPFPSPSPVAAPLPDVIVGQKNCKTEEGIGTCFL